MRVIALDHCSSGAIALVASALPLLIPAAASGLPLGRAWAPTETLSVEGFDYLAAPRLDLSPSLTPDLIGIAARLSPRLAEATGFFWDDGGWVEGWRLHRETSLLPPVHAPPGERYLLWRGEDPGTETLLFFAKVTADGVAEAETIGTILTGTNLYAGAVSADRRWAVAPDLKDLRAFVSDGPDSWWEVETGRDPLNQAAVVELDDTTALVAWDEVGGLLWGLLTDQGFEVRGIVQGPSSPVGPQLRPRPSGGHWMTWGSFQPSLAMAMFHDGSWSPTEMIPCAYLVQTQHSVLNSDMSRDGSEFPVVAWTAQRGGQTAICVCMPTDDGYATAEELPFAPNGVLPSVARDRNGDAWIAWWKFYDGVFWTHTYVTATAANVGAAGDAAGRTISWNLSEPAPETWWAVLRAGPGEAFESIARVRATQNLAMSWVDDSSAGGPLRYRIRRESVDKRYEWLSDEVIWDGATSADLALLSVDATPDRVRLVWQGPNAGELEATVERRTDASGWRALGFASRAGADQLRYEDSTVAPGGRYGYRLAYLEGGETQHTAASWVDVPERPVFALEGFQPNPARGIASVAFTLPASRRATLEVMDISGRRVFRKRLDGLAAGRHTVRLDGARELAPGLYLVRLAFDGRVLTARGVVVE